MTSAIFLRGARGDEYVIVAKADVLDMWSDWDRRRFVRDFGEATLRALLHQPPRWIGFSIFEDPYADLEHLEFALDEVLRQGRLVPVRIEPIWLPLEPGPSVMLRDLIKTKPDEPQPAEPFRPTRVEGVFTYELRLVDEIGTPLPGVPISVSVSGAPRRLVTDGDGRIRVDDATTATTLAQLPDLGAMQDVLRPRWEQIRNGDWVTDSEEHTYINCADPLPMVKLRRGRLHTIVFQPRVICARLLELLFDTNKTFLLPLAIEHIQSIVALYEKRPNSKLLIVGHTDITGHPDVNDSLSLNRAKAIRAYLTDDVDTWLDFYGGHMHVKARWGDTEDQLMLGAILAATGEQLTDTRVRHFQATRGLKVDGHIGEETRRALVSEYMAADGTTLPSSIKPLVHGCGEGFPLAVRGNKADHVHDRRVELFFFDATFGVLPPPTADISPPGSPEYPEWRRRAQETFDFYCRHGPSIELVVIDDGGTPFLSVGYRLRLPDGRTLEGSCDANGRTVIKGAPPDLGRLELNILDVTRESA